MTTTIIILWLIALLVRVVLDAPTIALAFALAQPVEATLAKPLARRRLFQRKAKQTYQERKVRRMERMWAASAQHFDLNHAA